jgi:hypothetical protein
MSSYLISSCIVNVDVGGGDKTVLLPPANENLGKTFWVRDLSGCAAAGKTITIQPSGGDTIDTQAQTLGIAETFGFYRLFAQSPTNWSILGGGNANNWIPGGPGPGGTGGGGGGPS